MSKKTKRLEKENMTLQRKQEGTNRSILEMAEERSKDKEDLERLRKQETQMRNIIKTMQEQGRGGPIQQELVDDEGTESEYDEEYDDEVEEDEEGDYVAEDEELAAELSTKPVYGPVVPPNLAEVRTINGDPRAPLVVNGLKH